MLTVQQIGIYVRIEAVSVRTQRFYQQLLNAEDLEQLEISPDKGVGNAIMVLQRV